MGADQAILQQRLWDAAARGESDTVRMLAARAAVDLDARNEDGFTAYNLATQKGHFNTALIILAARNAVYEARLGSFSEPVDVSRKSA